MGVIDHRQQADPEWALDLLKIAAPVRVGRKVGRTLYVQIGPLPSDDDLMIGVMDSPAIAERVATALNGRSRNGPG